MSIINNARTYDSFFNQKLAKKKEGTRQGYRYAINGFDKFCKLKFDRPQEYILEEFKAAKTKNIIDTLQAWMNQSTIDPHNMRVRMSFLNNYLYYRGVKIDPRDLKDLEYEEGEPEERRAVTLEEIRQICDESRSKKRALFVTLVSTRMAIW